MNRVRITITSFAFLATFAWLLVPEVKNSPAALWPSVLAVGLAFVTRDIYLSLFTGAFAGAILLRQGNPALAFTDLFSVHLVPALQDSWNINVLLFTLMMGGLVELLNRNGGMTSLADWILGGARTRRRAGLGAYGMGWLVFFDGLANAMLVGKTMRPAADRSGMSREKLAFIVDSTASPIAGLALISTWVTYEMSVIKQGFENVGNPELLASVAPFQWLVQSLPYRFYNYFMLLIVFLTIALSREFGPMYRAEQRCRPSEPAPETDSHGGPSKRRILLALIPLGVLVLGVFGGLYVQGGGLDHPFSLGTLIDAFGRADAARVFVLATAAAVLVALGLSALGRPQVAGGEGQVAIFFEGMKQMFLPTLILVFAWVLNGVIKEMGAAAFLVSLLDSDVPVGLLPSLVFLLAAAISFSTGTSWGTMAILMPLVIPVAVQWTGLTPDTAVSPVMFAAVGAVLAGAVFGDHCSPISDTTIVSAFGSGCDVMAHVRTQLPYALAAAGFAVLFGYGPAGWDVSPWILLPTGVLMCWILVRFGGRRVTGLETSVGPKKI